MRWNSLSLMLASAAMLGCQWAASNASVSALPAETSRIRARLQSCCSGSQWDRALAPEVQFLRYKMSSTQAEAPAASSPTPAPSPSPAAAESQRHAEFFVMIDPSHGGYDAGANFGGRLLEKDVTLKLARELKKELDERGIASRMLRDSDVDISLDRRAEIANEQHAGLYIALHAGRPGHGVRIYAPLLPNPEPAAGRFLPWESAQAPALDRSKLAARAVAGELEKKGLSVATLGLPVRPLNNVAGPAIAVELAPEGDDLQSLDGARRQSGVASAIASAIAQVRGQIGARP
jgi:N-acetylmuramoyl-L-alanine amidase